MVAIRDEERLGTHDLHDVGEDYWIGDGPQLLPESVVIRKVASCRFPLDGSFKESDHDALRVRIEGPDWAEIRVAGFEQIQAIGFCRGPRIFMRINMTGVERFQFDGREKSLQHLHRSPRIRRRRTIVDGVVIQGGMAVTCQRPASEPFMECRRGSRVAVVWGIVPWLIEATINMNEVVRSAP